MRLNQVARKLNIGKNTIIEFLDSHGFKVEDNPNTKIEGEQLELLAKEFADSALDKEEASSLSIGIKHPENVIINANTPKTTRRDDEDDEILIKDSQLEKRTDYFTKTEPTPEKPIPQHTSESPKLQGFKVVGKIDLNPKIAPKIEEKVAEPQDHKVTVPVEPDEIPIAEKAPEVRQEKIEVEQEIIPEKEVVPPPVSDVIEAKAETLKGLKVVGRIELPAKPDRPVASSDDSKDRKKKKRPRKRVPGNEAPPPVDKAKPQESDFKRKDRKVRPVKEEPTQKEIQEQIKATLAKLSTSGKPSNVSRSKYRREKRSAVAEATEKQIQKVLEESKVLKVNEFISTNDLANMMNVSVNEVISAFMSLGMFVSINQRLDAEALTIIADEFGYSVEFVDEKENADVETEDDTNEELEDRAPIVTIMGHVDHGKTSLLDYIRKTKITEGEAGGITQHIGAYDVMTESGKRIAFLDTPGHEAFTAMRARGAKLTDIVVIVVAADDNVMPQTKEALNHALVADVPIVIAINKIDKPSANPDKIREQLSAINILVEEWGGKYQCQEISAKTGKGIEELLDKVLLEAEMLELKANKNKNAVGTVVEAELDKGRGYVATILVQAGTLRNGDIIIAGAHHGRVKAMYDHRGKKLIEAIPSTPVLVLGLDGAPQAGDKFNAVDSEREAREIATKRQQLLREQGLRTKKHITLDEIGRRLAIGSFKELNIILKGDVDGSVEALSDSLLKLSTEEVQVNIKHKAVGQISESDVLLASATDAIIVGFQVRPSAGARKLAEQEEIEIRHYSIIYNAINEIRDAMEGLLAPEFEEVIPSNVEVRAVFRISKVGTVAGCMVTDGTIKRTNRIRVVRDGIVVFTGEIDALKRVKDDVSEVRHGFECGIRLKNFNDFKEGDIIEGFEQKEVKRTL